jgi:uncharacterized small protein (DUF1192 family)
MAKSRHGFFLDEANVKMSLNDLHESIVALQREVAALEALLARIGR